jgi:phosphoribosylaminoimidazole carboxylase
MLAAAASLLNIKVIILDVGPSGPAKQVVSLEPPHTHIDGSFTDPAKIRELASKVDVLTVEIEHVDVDALEELQETYKDLAIHPSPGTIRIIQDKFQQKCYLSTHSCPVSEFMEINSTLESIQAAVEKLGLPLMLKSRTLAYDGRGNFALRDLSQAQDALQCLRDRPLYAEKWVPFVMEIAVMVVRATSGEIRSYPAVETIHKDNICHLVFAPLRSRDPGIGERARKIAEAAVMTLDSVGVFGVEMFLMEDGTQLQCNHIHNPLITLIRSTVYK